MEVVAIFSFVKRGLCAVDFNHLVYPNLKACGSLVDIRLFIGEELKRPVHRQQQAVIKVINKIPRQVHEVRMYLWGLLLTNILIKQILRLLG